MSVDAPERAKVTGRLLFGNIREVEWNKDDAASVARAEAAFRDGLYTGMAAFETVTEDSWYGTRKVEQSTRTFNPETEQIRMTAQFAGG